MEPGKYCAWCGKKTGEAKDGEVSHGICIDCRIEYLEPELAAAEERRQSGITGDLD